MFSFANIIEFVESDGAADEKNRLEEKQRAARKARNGDASWKPR